MTPEITPAAEAALAAVMADPLLGLLGWERRYSRGADLLVGSLGAVDVRLYVRGENYPFRYCVVLPGGGNRSQRSLEGAILWLLAGVRSLLHGCRAVDPVVTQLVAEGARLRAERDEAREAMLAACRLVEAATAEADRLRAAHAAAEERAAPAYARGWEDGREAGAAMFDADATALDGDAADCTSSASQHYFGNRARESRAHAARIRALTPPTTPPTQEGDDHA